MPPKRAKLVSEASKKESKIVKKESNASAPSDAKSNIKVVPGNGKGNTKEKSKSSSKRKRDEVSDDEDEGEDEEDNNDEDEDNDEDSERRFNDVNYEP